MTNRSKNEQRAATTNQTHNQVQQWCFILQRAGYRLTPARRAIVATIADFCSPFDVHQVLACARREHPNLGLATVYRTLETLEALGLIQRLHDDQGCHNYIELGEESPPLVRCASCGRLDYLESVSLHALLDTVVAQYGYQIERYSLQLRGICGECQ